ncbi:unnamed protein product [Hapterophycus canaliculatus]
MRFALFPKVLALLLAATVLSAPMADAAGQTRKDGGEKATEAISELVTEEVTEDLGVGEQRPEHKHGSKSGKPWMATSSVRQTWDECVGMSVSDAMAVIRAARPDLRRIVKVPEGSMVTMDMRRDRVRVYCNAEDIVTRAPRIG